MTETLVHGYSSERTQQELSNEYQQGRILIDFKNLYVLVLWTKVASALEGLRNWLDCHSPLSTASCNGVAVGKKEGFVRAPYRSNSLTISRLPRELASQRGVEPSMLRAFT